MAILAAASLGADRVVTTDHLPGDVGRHTERFIRLTDAAEAA